MHDPNQPPISKEPDPDAVSKIGDFIATCCTLFIACINACNTVRGDNVEKVHFDSLDAKVKCDCSFLFCFFIFLKYQEN